MSWSISLSGDKAFVEQELATAAIEINTARIALQNAPGPLVVVSISGNSYVQPSLGGSGGGASFSISSYSPEPPPPQPEEPTADLSANTALAE